MCILDKLLRLLNEDNCFDMNLTKSEIKQILKIIPHKTYDVLVSYRMDKVLYIPAVSVDHAIEQAEEIEFNMKTGTYVDDSFEVNVEYTNKTGKWTGR